MELPIQLAFSTLRGLEDYALHSILRAQNDIGGELDIDVSAPLFSGLVLIRFPFRAAENLRMWIHNYSSGAFIAVESAFIVVADETLEKSQVLLHNDFLKKLREGDADRSRRKKKAEQTSTGNSSKPISPSEEIFLDDVRRTFQASHPDLSLALSYLPIDTAQKTHRTFRGSVSNPSHFLPFPTLTSHGLSYHVGEHVSDWLDKSHTTFSDADSVWRVNLTQAKLDVGLHIIGVPNDWTRISLSSFFKETHLSYEPTSQPVFPTTLRILIALALPSPAPKANPIPRPFGRTALLPSTAHLLASVHPFFSPFPPRVTLHPGSVILDPFVGSGSIPFHVQALAEARGIPIAIICGDIQVQNIEATARGAFNKPYIHPVVCDAGGRGGTWRDGLVDGIITDLPYGHRELSPRLLASLYPRFLRSAAQYTRNGVYAVLATASAPLLRRCLAQQPERWFESVWEGEREVFIGGMRVWVFLLIRSEILFKEVSE